MEPQEKAEELSNKIYRKIDWSTTAMPDVKRRLANEIALIDVNGKLETISGLEDSVWAANMKSFWQEVKEILTKR